MNKSKGKIGASHLNDQLQVSLVFYRFRSATHPYTTGQTMIQLNRVLRISRILKVTGKTLTYILFQHRTVYRHIIILIICVVICKTVAYLGKNNVHAIPGQTSRVMRGV